MVQVEVKNKVVIEIRKGKFINIYASSDTEVYVVSDTLLAKFEPDEVFPLGTAHDLFTGKDSRFLKDHGV